MTLRSLSRNITKSPDPVDTFLLSFQRAFPGVSPDFRSSPFGLRCGFGYDPNKHLLLEILRKEDSKHTIRGGKTMNTLNSLQGKIALVTGASRGAGRGIAEELGKAGAYVFGTGISVAGSSTHGWPGTIDETVRAIGDAGGQAAAIRCDHTVDEETEHVVETIRKEQGRLDIVVNNVWGGNEYSI